MSNWRYTEEFKSEAVKQVEEARTDIFDYIEEFYNRVRRHSYLVQMSPYEYEKAAACGSQ